MWILADWVELLASVPLIVATKALDRKSLQTAFNFGPAWRLLPFWWSGRFSTFQLTFVIVSCDVTSSQLPCHFCSKLLVTAIDFKLAYPITAHSISPLVSSNEFLCLGWFKLCLLWLSFLKLVKNHYHLKWYCLRVLMREAFDWYIIAFDRYIMDRYILVMHEVCYADSIECCMNQI